MEHSLLKRYCIGIAASDSDNGILEAYPQETMPLFTGNAVDENRLKANIKDSTGKRTNVELRDKNTITAIWLHRNSNRMTAPNIRKNEKVEIYRYGDTTTFYWVVLNYDFDLRTYEHVLWGFNNTDTYGEKASIDKMYKALVSTMEQMNYFKTADNNGEVTTYECSINTKDGIVYVIKDGRGNFIKLESKPDKLTITINEDVEVNTKRVVVNASESVTVNTVHTTVNSKQDVIVNTDVATVNADSSCTVNTDVSTVNASKACTVNTNIMTINSSLCNINP